MPSIEFGFITILKPVDQCLRGLIGMRQSRFLFHAFLLFSISAYSISSQSAPNIDNVSDANDKSVMTITGEGFGNPEFKMILKDDADTHVLREYLQINSSYSHEEIWDQKGSPWADPLEIRESSTHLKNDGDAAYYGKRKAFNGWLAPLKEHSSNQIYVSWLFKPLSSIGNNGGSNKLIRIWDSGDGENTRMAWDQMHVVYWNKNIDSSGNIQWGGWNGKVNSWNRLELWMDGDTQEMKIWTNGDLVIDVDNFSKADVPEPLNVGLIGFDPSVASNYENVEFFLDKIYTSTNRQRVEFSTDPQWNKGNPDNLVQIPSYWGENKIEVVPNLEHFENGQEIYAYVVGPDGSVNKDGYPVRCNQCPAPIESFEVD